MSDLQTVNVDPSTASVDSRADDAETQPENVFTWRTVNAATGLVEIVESFPSLADALAGIAQVAWEEPTNRWLDFVVGEGAGEVVATALFGPGLELLVTTADGRRLAFAMPEFYREAMRPGI